MGIPGSLAIGAAGGALLGGGIVSLFGGNRKTALQFGATTAAGGAVAGLATGVAAMFTSPVRAALLGAAAASLVPIGLGVTASRVNDPNGALGAATGVSALGIAGGTIALLGAALLLRR